MEELIQQLQPVIIQGAVVIITALTAYVSYYVKKFLAEKIDTDTKKTIVGNVVRFVEQTYKDLHGPEKLEKAKQEILEELQEKGIKISERELNVLIEAAVNGMNEGWAKPIEGVILESLPEVKE